MNKVTFASVLAVILGLFLITITAIKFDWVGMVRRGDSIIQIKTEKKEESTPKGEEIDKRQKQVEVSCTKSVSENNFFATHTLQVYFVNGSIKTASLDVNASYQDQVGKSAFDAFVQGYTDLYTKYNGIQGTFISIIPSDTQFQYHQEIDYGVIDESSLLEKGLPVLEPRENSTIDHLQISYTNQGYTCTQH